MFDTLPQPPIDALHAIMESYRVDPRPGKIDLGVGVYRNENGVSPVMDAVRQAEGHLLTSEDTKAYLPLQGDARFIEGMTKLLCPDGVPEDVGCVQTVGGTGGVHLAIALAARASPGAQVLLGLPSWPNHESIVKHSGLGLTTFRHVDPADQGLCFDEMIETVNAARVGDILILHGPCHNPTGVDFTASQWRYLFAACEFSGVIPLIDAAYFGLGGTLKDDLAMLRMALTACPEAMLVMSCSKAFSLYRERVGIVFVRSKTAAQAKTVQRTLEGIGRSTYSMPPSHGAAAVGHILATPDLKESWEAELSSMRARLLQVRSQLAAHATVCPSLAHVASQKGIFSILPIGSDVVKSLAHGHGIHMPLSGRMNIAGFKTGDIERFVGALGEVLENSDA